MKWTKELPIDPGFYWHRRHSGCGPDVIQVKRKEDYFEIDGTHVFVYVGEWAGPSLNQRNRNEP